MLKLTAAQRDRAEDFLRCDARPLEAAVRAHTCGAAPLEDVLASLAAFAVVPGGYGRGLEPDAQAHEPSVLDTLTALQILQRLRVAPDHPVVRAARSYLLSTRDAERGDWLLRPVVAADTPSAPWWKRASDQGPACRLNPTAEVLGCLLWFGDEADAALIDAVSRDVRHALDDHDGPLEMHDLFCVSRLSCTPGLDAAWAAALTQRVARDLAATVSPDPAAWETYGIKPWWVADTPGDPRLAQLPPGLLDAMLDHELARQGGDGGWSPFWDWGGLHPDHWPAARAAWTGVVTEHNLRVFEAFGRL